MHEFFRPKVEELEFVRVYMPDYNHPRMNNQPRNTTDGATTQS